MLVQRVPSHVGTEGTEEADVRAEPGASGALSQVREDRVARDVWTDWGLEEMEGQFDDEGSRAVLSEDGDYSSES